ncbi:Uncharacterized protein TCAP_00872, partial [Tolypocladium capitatum]
MAMVLADILRGRRRDATTGPRDCLPSNVDGNNTTADDVEHAIALDLIPPRHARAKSARGLIQATARALPFHLPRELWLEILSYLDFGDISRIRLTCKAIRYSISKPTIRLLIPDWHRARWSTCTVCLQYNPAHTHVFCETAADGRMKNLPNKPQCIECIAQRNGFRVGSRYLVNRRGAVCICRYCGRPIVTESASGSDEFHPECYRRHRRTLLLSFSCFGFNFIFFSLAAYIYVRFDPP